MLYLSQMLHQSLYIACFGEATVTLVFLLDFSDRQVYYQGESVK
jgi:hypothetical protein